MRVPVARSKRAGGFGRWLSLQIAVAVIAAFGVSMMFAGGSGPQPLPVSGDGGKSVRRVVHDAATDSTVLQFDAQQQAARAAMASFTPTTAPAVVTVPPAARAAKDAAKDKAVAVLPPRRAVPGPGAATPEGPPTTTVEVAAAPPPSPVLQNWRVVGVDIPGSGRVRRYIPSGSDLMKPADYAWTASKNAVKKVATFGEYLGL